MNADQRLSGWRPEVSIIVAAYNSDRYVAETFDSIFAQSFQDFEVVFVDDGSTDSTLAIARDYQARHRDRMVVISQANRGIAAARNTALANARGSIFAFLDSDDVWMPSFLDVHVRILKANPGVAVVTGNGINRGGAENGRPVRPIDDPRPAPDLQDILRDEAAVFIMSVFRREVADAIGGFDEGFRTNEDYDFWIRAAQAGFRFTRHSQPLGYYRRHADSLSANDTRMLTGILRVYRKALPQCRLGSSERAIVEQQIARFEVERLVATARAALDRSDVDTALESLEGLRESRRSRSLAMFIALLHRSPRTGLALYRGWRRFRFPAAENSLTSAERLQRTPAC